MEGYSYKADKSNTTRGNAKAPVINKDSANVGIT
jgi:hypothetical protein